MAYPSESKEARRLYYARNKARILELGAAYRARKRDEILKRKRAYSAANREKIRAKNAVYRADTREQLRAKARIYKQKKTAQRRLARALYAQENQEDLRQRLLLTQEARKARQKQYAIAYRKANRDTLNAKQRAYYHRRPQEVSQAAGQRNRARRLRTPLNTLTASQWKAIKAHYGSRCVYCGQRSERLTQDHIIPLSKGGTHTVQNVVPACRSCNSKKQAGPPLKPIQPLLLIAV
jgi:5-methylcytosine-specific restriction endonuclease McrA